MTFRTEYWKQFSFLISVILCLLFFVTTHIISRELLYKLINAEVSSTINSVVNLQTNLILERIQEQENKNVLQQMFDVYELNRVKRENENTDLKGLCKAIRKECPIKGAIGPPGLPGLAGQKGDQGDIGSPGLPGRTLK